MNKRHLSVAVIAALALSSSTFASAEGGSHRSTGGYEHTGSVALIGLSNNSAVLTIDTSSTTPSFHFDTSTASPQIDLDPSELTTHFDTSTATSGFDDEPGISDDGVGDDAFLPASAPFDPENPNDGANPMIPPAASGTPPAWVTQPHAKSNGDNRDHSDHSSEESQD